jgi:DNA-binding MarR family transcriptional regulator
MMLIDQLRNYPGYALRRASSQMMADLTSRLAKLELRPLESSILMLINDNPNVKQADLCAALGVQRANMVPIIARLDSRGLLLRVPLDKRSEGLSLTDTGRAITQDAKFEVEAHEAELCRRAGQTDMDQLLRSLNRIWQLQPQ